MRKPLRIALALAAAAAAGLGLLSLPWHGARPASAPILSGVARGTGALRAGAASVNVDLPPGAPIGGFARFTWSSAGIRDPIHARAVVLGVPGCRVAIASAELLIVSEPLRRKVEALVADLRLDGLVVAATHTHAGPGGYVDNVLVERAGLGPHDPRLLDLLAGAIARAIREADAAAAPARLAVARGAAPHLVRARGGGTVDGRVVSLRFAGLGGEPVAELLLFAAHATTLGKGNRLLSGDWPGRFAALPGRGVVVFLQGAIGDQSAQVPPGDPATRPERYGEALRAVADGLPATTPPEPVTLAVASASARLPAPSPGAVPAPLRPAVATIAWGLLPEEARVTALRVGPALLVATPAEPTAAVAAAWREATGAEIASLADGYVGYVDTAERTARGEGEAVRTWFGPEFAERLGSAVAAAARAAGP